MNPDELWGGVGRVLASGTAGVATGAQTGNPWLGYLAMAIAFLAFETAMLLRRRRMEASSNPYPRRPVHPDVLHAIETAVANAMERPTGRKDADSARGRRGEGEK